MAHIYKIEVGDCLYIGSTKDMKQRQYRHNSDIRIGTNYPIYNYCRENGIHKVELIDLEYVDIEDRFIVEQYYIDEFKTGHKLLNCFNPYGFDKKASMKAYHQDNKDKIKENKKAYYEANKEKIKEREKAYYDANKDKKKTT